MTDATPLDEILPPRHRPWYRKKRYLLPILFVIAMVVVGAMFGGDPSPPRVSPAEGAASPGESGAARCEPAAQYVLNAITEGLVNFGDVTLSGGQAVRSRDFESLWFIATEVHGPDLPEEATAVWAVDRNDPRVTAIFAVGELADEISLWGDVVLAENPPRLSDDGAQQAQACLEQAG